MADRIFKCENSDVQRVFCSILNQMFGIITSRYNATQAPFILVNIDRKHIMEMTVNAMRWKAHTRVTQETVDAMQLIVDPDVMLAFLFK